jgi:hypothetical protein
LYCGFQRPWLFRNDIARTTLKISEAELRLITGDGSYGLRGSVYPEKRKGAGEAGTVGSLSAGVNAIVDALSVLGVRHIDTPARLIGCGNPFSTREHVSPPERRCPVPPRGRRNCRQSPRSAALIRRRLFPKSSPKMTGMSVVWT